MEGKERESTTEKERGRGKKEERPERTRNRQINNLSLK
jgi:hypothetical protein